MWSQALKQTCDLATCAVHVCILICLFLEQYTISCSPGSIDDRMQSTANLQNMFKCVTPGMSPFRILYNLEVIRSMIRDVINVIKLVSLK